MATTAGGAARAELFWHRMAIGLAIFIILGFLQFALRGFVDPVAAPFWVHLHGVAMLAWLALLIVQPTLVSRDNPALHRRLGWIGAGLALFITFLGIFTGVASLMLNRFPPFFSPPYFSGSDRDRITGLRRDGRLGDPATARDRLAPAADDRRDDRHSRTGAGTPAADPDHGAMGRTCGRAVPVGRRRDRCGLRSAQSRRSASCDMGDRGGCHRHTHRHIAAVDDAPVIGLAERLAG